MVEPSIHGATISEMKKTEWVRNLLALAALALLVYLLYTALTAN